MEKKREKKKAPTAPDIGTPRPQPRWRKSLGRAQGLSLSTRALLFCFMFLLWLPAATPPLLDPPAGTQQQKLTQVGKTCFNFF